MVFGRLTIVAQACTRVLRELESQTENFLFIIPMYDYVYMYSDTLVLHYFKYYDSSCKEIF